MKEREENIRKYYHEQLPEPEIPADEAWANMDGILGSGAAPVKSPEVIARLLKYKWTLLCTGTIAVVSAIVFIKTTLPADNKKSLKIKDDYTTNIDTTNHESNTGKISLVPKAIVSGTLNIVSNASTGSVLKSVQQNQANPSTIHKNANSTENTKLAQQGKSDQSPEPGISKKYPAGKWAEHTGRNSPHAIALLGNNERENIPEKRDQSNRRKLNKDEESGQANTGSGNESNLAGKSSNNRETADFNKNPEFRKGVPTILFPRPVSFSTNQHLFARNKTAVQIPQFQTSILHHEKSTGFHFGPEWNMTSSLIRTDYLFAGKDSISKPALLLIPGIFISKNWNRHAISFTFSPRQSYFGNGKTVVHAVDSITINDSLKTYNNLNLIKASGLNFSLYYHYQATNLFALGGGISYSLFLNALMRKEIENYEGRILPGALVNLNRSAGLAEKIHPHVLALKAGALLSPGRFQAGLNLIVPVTSISRMQHAPLKSLNGQLFLRFSIY